MDSSWILFAITIPAPFLFVVGFYSGKHHVKRLARHGGEEWYPELVQDVVEKYRQEQLHGGTDD